MAEPAPPGGTIPPNQDSRREQRYPSLSPAEIERLGRFGTRAPGEMLARTGESGHGASAVGDGAQVVAALHAYLARPTARIAAEPLAVPA